MRVLWFTNALIPQAYDAFGLRQVYFGGGWAGALLDAFSQRYPEVDLCVASADSCSSIQSSRRANVEFVRFPCRRPLPIAIRIVRDYKPDVVHIHGSEFFYGMVAQQADIASKTAVSLQGLMGPCSTWPAFFGNLTPLQVLKMHRIPEIGAWRGLIPSYLSFRRGAQRERMMLSAIQHVMGRTAFDRAYVTAVNPQIRYHQVGELLRTPFWQKRWSVEGCTRNSIIFSNAGHPRKGVEVLLDAFGIVRHRFPDAELRVAGGLSVRSGYGRYVRKLLLSRPGVRLLGSLAAEEMAQSLTNAHVFVSPSFIDNSPNAVCEAQLLGMPVVATYVGGVPSLVQDSTTGLLTIAGDAPSLAARIMQFMDDDTLARYCGANARSEARQRHDPERVIADLHRTYCEVSGPSHPTASGQLLPQSLTR